MEMLRREKFLINLRAILWDGRGDELWHELWAEEDWGIFFYKKFKSFSN